MLKKYYAHVVAGEERRANLIEIKKLLKEKDHREAFARLVDGNFDEIMKCLVDEDAKVRKNAAEILGRMHCHDAADVLMDAYAEEEQLFVRSTYVEALAQINCKAYLPQFKERLKTLEAYDAPENERKHIHAEITALRELILEKDGLHKATFTGYHNNNEIMLTTLPAFRDVLAEQIPGPKKLLKSGVRFQAGDLDEVLNIRVYKELLYVVHGAGKMTADPADIAGKLAASDLMQILLENHEEDGPFYFRLSMPEVWMKKDRGNFTRKCAAAIEEAFGGQLINSASNYEVEVKLLPGPEETLVPFLALTTIPDERFRYRRYHVAASMRPMVAAGLMALAKPYLKEHAQVLDPFCGTGALLIERRYAGTVRNAYGIDIFGEAIDKARLNTKTAGMQINYINRDYFDFKHEYLFDEILADMPVLQEKEELDLLYKRFLEKSHQMLTPQGRIFLYSNEAGLVKKQLRLQQNFRIVKEFCIQEKTGRYFWVLEKK